MDTQQSYVIIGNGITSITAAEMLRAEDASCAITIVADDPSPAYYRPALKDYLGGRLAEERLLARPRTFYPEQRIVFVPARVIGINTMQHYVQLHNGKYINYSKLLLANGARPRTLSCPGLNLAGISTLRTLADYQEVLRCLNNTHRVVVCGSGTLALESVETLHNRGYQVTHLIRSDTIWSEVLDLVASDIVLQEELRAGVDVRTREEIAEIVGKNGRVSHVITKRGERIACELVLIAVGIEPLTDFIHASGIVCGQGVKVDSGMRTNVPDIYAAGDVVETRDEFTGRRRLLGQWFPAIQQAQVAACNMLGLLSPHHPFYPGSNSQARTAYLNYYNATFLYGLDFVSVGLTICPSLPGYQEVLAEPQPRNYRKVILKNGIIVGTLLLGERKQGLAFKRAIDHRVNIAPVAHQLFAEDFNLDGWLDQQLVPDPVLNMTKEGISEEFSAGKQKSVETVAIMDEEYRRNFQPKEVDAYLVPIPHPRVPVVVTEMQLNKDDQTNLITVGRQQDSSLLLEHRSVSRLHAEITCAGGEYLLRDTRSSNGTFVNGSPLASAGISPYKLRHHDQIRFGDVQFRFEYRPRLSNTRTLASVPASLSSNFQHIQGTELHASVSRLIPAAILDTLADTPTLVLVGQNTMPKVLPLEHGRRYTLGRDDQNDIVLDDSSSSRQHAEIFSTPDGFYIRDVKSRYGVLVNATKINNAYHLSHGDRVVLGNLLLYFSFPPHDTRKQTTTNTQAVLPRIAPVGVPALSKEETMRVQAFKGAPLVKNNTSMTKALIVEAGLDRGRIGATSIQPYLPQGISHSDAPVPGLEHRRTVQHLGKERVVFEIAMCIGCDRCMDACPLPISSLVTITDLNQATVIAAEGAQGSSQALASALPSQVIRFTHECIMCGSCVPVCPVDNHRDLLMLSLKQYIGVSWNSQPNMSHVAEALPKGWTVSLLLQRLREQVMLRDPQQVPDNYLLHLVASSKQRALTPGEVLIREGEYGRDFYLILEGFLQLAATSNENTELPLAMLRRGEYIGEDGMLTGQPYKSSVCAKTFVLLLQVPEQVMQRLMEIVPTVRAHFEQINNARSLRSILRRMVLFQGVAETDIEKLIRTTIVKQYERNEQLFTEDTNDRPVRETLHILLEGFVKVARHTTLRTRQQKGKGDERIIAYRQGGDYFAGGLDLLGDGQAVTVTTINRCRIAEVPRQTLLALFQKYPEVNHRFSIRLREYLETVVSTQGYALAGGPFQHFSPTSRLTDLNVQAGLHSLIQDGVVEGTEVLVIDLDKCIHCSECEEACARRHGNSRMNRKGMIVGNISIATACRQCQDPVCMLCSRAGIARHPNGEVYITESCIGCGICAERCPYGAISIVNHEDEPAVSSWQRFSTFFSKSVSARRPQRTLPVLNKQSTGRDTEGGRWKQGRGPALSLHAAPGPLDQPQAQSAYEQLRKKIAIKCDLCVGYRDQACVEACPTGAVLRIQPIRFFGSTEEILSRRTN